MTNSDQPRYSMLIQWSNEDNAYLVALPEWQNEVQDIFAHGDTYEEAAKNGRGCLEFLTKSAKELSEDLPEPDVHISKNEAEEIERKWDELLASPESQAYMAKMAAELDADFEAGRLIPGGFGGSGEFTEELEAAMKALIGRVRQGMMVRDQEALTRLINEFLSKINEGKSERRKALDEMLQPSIDTGTYDIPIPEDFERIPYEEALKGKYTHQAKGSAIPLTPEQQAELEALKALPDDEIDTSDIPEITDFTGFQRGLFYNGNKDSIELWKHNPRKAFNQHLEFLQCMCDGVSASLERLRKGIEEQGLFSDSGEEQ